MSKSNVIYALLQRANLFKLIDVNLKNSDNLYFVLFLRFLIILFDKSTYLPWCFYFGIYNFTHHEKSLDFT